MTKEDRIYVEDDTLGKLAKKQNELFQRIKKGSIEDVDAILEGLQEMIENKWKPLLMQASDFEHLNVDRMSNLRETLKTLPENFIVAFDVDKEIKTTTIRAGAKRVYGIHLRLGRTTRMCCLKDILSSGYDLADPRETISFILETKEKLGFYPGSTVYCLGKSVGSIYDEKLFLRFRLNPQVNQWTVDTVRSNKAGSLPRFESGEYIVTAVHEDFEY
ncbi:MAG: hypothetical protein HYW78_04205 [Parcubacteria group bacterium]|nr:hypothetical protein [Parcubacteria group bacterium]